MKKKQLIKALVLSAVLAAFPAAGVTASAEDAAPEAIADAPVAVAAEAAPAPVAVEAAPVVAEAAPVVAEVVAEPVVVAADNNDSAPAADTKADNTAKADDTAKAEDTAKADEKTEAKAEDTAKAEETAKADEKTEAKAEEKADEKTEAKDDDTAKDKEGAKADAKADETPVEDDPFPIEVPTITTAKIDKDVIKAGDKAKVEAKVDSGFTIVGVDKNGDPVTVDYFSGTRFFSSDNSIATVDNDGTIHAKKEGKVTIWVETLDGILEPVTLDITESYNVLLIDKSESVKGKGLAKEKAAAISYADEVLKVNKESHVAVIAMGSETTTKTLSGWTSNLTDIKNIINGIKAEGGSVYSEAIKQAGALLNTIPYYKQGYNKNIVMFSDGADTYGDREYAMDCLDDILYKDNFVGYDKYGNPMYEYVTDDKGEIVTDEFGNPLIANHRDRTTNFYAFGVYDSATKDGKKDGEGFLKSLAADIEVAPNGDVAIIDNYYEVTSVKDMQPTFKNIASKKVITEYSTVSNLIGFDVYVYGKASSSSDSKAAKAKDKKSGDSPKTADNSGIYTIALFALLGAGAMAFSAKKRFED